MKKALLLLLFLPIMLISQTDETTDKDNSEKNKNFWYKWDIGINGGININNPISENNAFDDLNYMGNLYGLTLIYHFNRFIAFKADLDIENKGWIIEDYELPHDINPSGTSILNLENVTQVLDYFDIPAFLHIGFGKKLKLDLNIGPYFGFKIKDEIYAYEPDGTQLSSSQTRGAIGIGEFENFDYGLVYGIGLDYQFHERFSLGFDALYEKGMKIINTDGYKNSSLDFDFGINCRIGKREKKLFK
ncbi:MAG: hypothetical protein CL846_06275 [Crocinitomicaceae bacterium]|nr:hypothetical protein [Crocinitomicaceae bacterium]|tara:strand:+ start:7920 stop:8657 length:738 start_codon:yes stop_codon:yes gene_type:complete